MGLKRQGGVDTADIWQVEVWHGGKLTQTDDFEILDEVEMFIDDIINGTDRSDEANYEFRLKKVF